MLTVNSESTVASVTFLSGTNVSRESREDVDDDDERQGVPVALRLAAGELAG
jgi:hypothetical protein